MKVIKQVFMANPSSWPGSRGRFYDLEVRANDDGSFEVVNLYGYLGTQRSPYSKHPVVKYHGPDKGTALAECAKLVAQKEKLGYTVGRGE